MPITFTTKTIRITVVPSDSTANTTPTARTFSVMPIAKGSSPLTTGGSSTRPSPATIQSTSSLPAVSLPLAPTASSQIPSISPAPKSRTKHAAAQGAASADPLQNTGARVVVEALSIVLGVTILALLIWWLQNSYFWAKYNDPELAWGEKRRGWRTGHIQKLRDPADDDQYRALKVWTKKWIRMPLWYARCFLDWPGVAIYNWKKAWKKRNGTWDPEKIVEADERGAADSTACRILGRWSSNDRTRTNLGDLEVQAVRTPRPQQDGEDFWPCPTNGFAPWTLSVPEHQVEKALPDPPYLREIEEDLQPGAFRTLHQVLAGQTAKSSVSIVWASKGDVSGTQTPWPAAMSVFSNDVNIVDEYRTVFPNGSSFYSQPVDSSAMDHGDNLEISHQSSPGVSEDSWAPDEDYGDLVSQWLSDLPTDLNQPSPDEESANDHDRIESERRTSFTGFSPATLTAMLKDRDAKRELAGPYHEHLKAMKKARNEKIANGKADSEDGIESAWKRYWRPGIE